MTPRSTTVPGSRREFLHRGVGGLGASLAVGSSQVLGASDRIRLGIIGAGGQGKFLMRAALACPGVEFAGVADVYSRRHEEARQLVPGVPCWFDYRDLLQDRSIDAVIIATPQHLHCEHFVASMGAGKHVYLEKTMAFTVEHAKRMRAAYRQAAKTVQIGLQGCSLGTIEPARKLIDDGKVGTITEIHCHMYRNTPHGKPQWARPVPADVNEHNVRWEAFLGGAPPRPFDPQRFINWRFYWDYSGGNVFENMVHQLAIWYKILGLSVPREVTMRGGILLWKDGREVPDTMTVSMGHSEGLFFNWASGFGNAELGEREMLLGSDGSLQHDWTSLCYVPEKVNRPDDTKSVVTPKGEQHMRNFIDCLRSGRTPNCPFEIGFRTAITCRMAVESYLQRRTVHWDPAQEAIV